MSRYQFLAAFVALMPLAMAQPDRTTMAFPDANKPKILKINTTMSNLTVRGANVNEVQFEAAEDDKSFRTKFSRRLDGRMSADTEGLRPVRLNGGRDFRLEVDNNVMTLSNWNGGHLKVTVPMDTILKLQCSSGDIRVENVAGELDLNASMGNIYINEAQGSVLAHASMGDITAVIGRPQANNAVSLATAMGKVDLTMPADSKATVYVKESMMSELFSDFDITPAGVETNTEATQKGKRVRSMSKGTINGGGTEMRLTSNMGAVMIRKRK